MSREASETSQERHMDTILMSQADIAIAEAENRELPVIDWEDTDGI